LTLEIRPTDALETIRSLCLESGLEDGPFGNILAAFGCFDDDRMAGCAVLEQKGDRFAIEWVAVDRDFRGNGWGSRLVSRVEVEARSRGAKELWALARAPGFFQKLGYRAVGDEEAAISTGACSKCKQYLRTCHPSVVVKGL